MPAFWQACLTMAWFFWRGALIEVWIDELQLLAVLGANAVRPALPAGLVEQLVGLLDI